VRLPNFSGSGTLNITETGITGSPSGCAIALKYQQNNATTSTTVATVSFTPATGVQQLAVTPTTLTGDNYVATYSCSTYPTAGSISISFSPILAIAQDPCLIAPKTSAVINLTTTSSTQLVALAAGKKVYVCGLAISSAATAGTTITVNYGTGTACATGTVALTGAIPLGQYTPLVLASDGSEFTAPVGNALCATASATGGIAGVLTYVQQ
jgi:hypothetical protein